MPTIENYEVEVTLRFMVGADDSTDATKEASKVIDKILLDPRVQNGPSGIIYNVTSVQTEDILDDAPASQDLLANL